MKKGVTENWMGFADDSPPVMPYTLKNFETMPLFAWFVSYCRGLCPRTPKV